MQAWEIREARQKAMRGVPGSNYLYRTILFGHNRNLKKGGMMPLLVIGYERMFVPGKKLETDRLDYNFREELV